MKRPVIVWIDDDTVTQVIVYPNDGSAPTTHEGWFRDVPPDDQLARDVHLVTDLLLRIEVEDEYYDRGHEAACQRLRVAFGLDEA